MKWTAWERVAGAKLAFTDIIYEKKQHLELGGGVARITVNRPARYNSFTKHTMEEMFLALYDANHDQRIGVVVLTGAGGHFGTGGDVEWEQESGGRPYYWDREPDRLTRICRKPLVAAVRGYCIGGSNHLAYFSDFTIAAEDAIFGQNGPRVSSPADGYIVSYLVRVVGSKRAREMWMLCRRYTALEALEMGLVNKVVRRDRLDEEVDRWCEEVLSASPGCLEILKASFDWEIDSLPQVGNIVGWLYPNWFESPEGREGGNAFKEKRRPDFWKVRLRGS